jgi:imidazolonepropionase
MNKTRLIGPFSQILTMDHLNSKGPLADEKLEIIEDAGILVTDEIIEAIGPYRELRKQGGVEESIEGSLVAMPGMIDVHTHICWSGSRAGDYAFRLAGKTYLEIAAAGGGIWSTVTKTREAEEQALTTITAERAERMLHQGTTTIEVKSGYGLQVEAELKMLRSIKAAGRITGADLISTCLGAHIKPRDFEGSPRAYLEHLIGHLLPAVKKENLANRVDIYIDEGAFSAEDARYYLNASKELGFDIVIHADQFYPGGLDLAIETGAVSADHLEASNYNDLNRLALSNVIPVALPGASLGLAARFAPARKMLDLGTSLVIASDWNPGSAPMGRLLTQASLIGVFEKLTMAETLAALTFRAAPALNLSDRGILKKGMLADFIAFPCSDWREIIYNQGSLEPSGVWKRGRREERGEK